MRKIKEQTSGRGGEKKEKKRRWGRGGAPLCHSPAVVICGRSRGSWKPLATILIREGQESERITDRKLLKNITVLLRSQNEEENELKKRRRI